MNNDQVDRSDSPAAAPTDGAALQRRRVLIAAIALVAIVALVGAWLLTRGGEDTVGNAGGSTAAPVDGLLRLPQDPDERYSITIDAAVVDGAYGSPERVWVSMYLGDERQVRMFDGDGAELWTRPIEDNALVQQLGEDLVFGTYEEGDHPLTLVDADTGAELWSTTASNVVGAVIIDGNIVISAAAESDAATLTAIDGATGDQIAERRFDSVYRNLVTPPNDGVFFGYDNDEIVVVDGRLNPVGGPIPASAAGTPTSVAQMGTEILVARPGELTRYGLDGTEIATVDFDADSVSLLAGVDGSTWMYFASNVCGAVDVSGEQAETLWQIDECLFGLTPEVTLRYGGGDPYALVNIVGSGPSLVNATTGEIAMSAADSTLFASANGVLDWGSTAAVGRSVPSGNELFSVPISGNQQFNPLDNGYAILDSPGPSVTMTVSG